MCGAPDQDTLAPLTPGSGETVVQGRVVKGGAPLPGAYVRLLDGTGEFTAEVQTSATGQFRFFAADGEWTLRVLAPGQVVDSPVRATQGQVTETVVEVPS
ncbi:MAG: DUF1416 domain-containing protein [Actinomycetota bacterium]|nr:DUF1416 domain-containing protein [Actinomycetota bacterium]